MKWFFELATLTNNIGLLRVLDGGKDQFPELTAITNNIGNFVKALGAGLFIAVLGIVAIIFMTSFGSERRALLAKTAIAMAFIGLGLIVAASTVQTLITRVFGG
jgi:type II secretory pathway component PulF